jgi:hypothetical protein
VDEVIQDEDPGVPAGRRPGFIMFMTIAGGWVTIWPVLTVGEHLKIPVHPGDAS